jgi:hypothetical protein
MVCSRLMNALKAHVENGRVVLDEPMDLPDGTALHVMLVNDGDVHDIDPEIDAAWCEEARRRSAHLRSGEVKPIPWEQVERRLFSKL